MICKFTCPGGHVLQGLETQLGQSCICPQCGVTFTVQTISPVAAPAPVMPAAAFPFSSAPVVRPSQLPSAFPQPAAQRPIEPVHEAAEATGEDAVPDFNAEWRREGFSFEGKSSGANEAVASDGVEDMADFTAPAPADDSNDFLASVASAGAGRFDPSALEGLGDTGTGNESSDDSPNGADFTSAGRHSGGAKKFYHIRCPKKHLLEVRGDALNTDMDCPACGTRFHIRLDRTLEFRRQREQEIERSDAKKGQIWLSVAIAAGTIIVLAIVGIIIMSSTGH